MITFIEGILEEKQPTRAVLNVGGIGYEIFIPLSSYDRLPIEGSSCRLLIHDYLREDAHLLYGFSQNHERELFAQLIGISGVGPKLGIAALSGLSVRDFKLAIIESDAKRLATISGVGKRLAERLIVELRGKITAGEALALSSDEPNQDIRLRDTVLALVSLGYKQTDALKMAKEAAAACPEADAEELIRQALSS